MPVILIDLPPHGVSESNLAEIREIMPEYDVRVTQDPGEIEALCDEVEILAGSPEKDILLSGRKLRWYQQWSAGSDWLTSYPETVERPFIATSASGVHPIQIAEHVFALMLAFVRRLPEALYNQSNRKWDVPASETVGELYEQTLLMVGLGSIGERIALIGSAYGMRVLGMRRSDVEPPDGVEAVHPPDEMPDLLPEADFVVLAPPLTSETARMIGERELQSMKRSAFLVNVGRGKLIDEGALIRALQEGWIAGAGLDVFETEPLPPDSPLWGMPNVIVTPHSAGASPRYYERAMSIFIENLRRYREGTELCNLVDKAAGY